MKPKLKKLPALKAWVPRPCRAWAFVDDRGNIYSIYPPDIKRKTFEPYNKERLIRVEVIPILAANRRTKKGKVRRA